MKCSWTKWLIDLNEELGSLVLIRRAVTGLRCKLRKFLSLRCVRNKDRRAVEPIVRLTRPKVLDLLADVKFVVHTLAPPKYRFWKENTAGACPRPVAVTPGPQGIILVLDYDFEPPFSRLLQFEYQEGESQRRPRSVLQ